MCDYNCILSLHTHTELDVRYMYTYLFNSIYYHFYVFVLKIYQFEYVSPALIKSSIQCVHLCVDSAIAGASLYGCRQNKPEQHRGMVALPGERTAVVA